MTRKETKLIKLDLDTYNRLDGVREKGQSFSFVVDKLLDLYIMLTDVSDALGPSHYLKSDKPPGKGEPK